MMNIRVMMILWDNYTWEIGIFWSGKDEYMGNDDILGQLNRTDRNLLSLKMMHTG